MQDHAILHQLLTDYATTFDNDHRKTVEAEIWDAFGTTGAVFVLDMARFTQTCIERGIVYYLSLVQRMHDVVTPIIADEGGGIIKFEADNCFAWFKTTEDAIDAAIAIQKAIVAANRLTPKELDIGLSCGIDYGEFLLIDHKDFYGNPVNRASKLGEDIAEPGEILVTKDAMHALAHVERYPFEEKKYMISGMALDVCGVQYETD